MTLTIASGDFLGGAFIGEIAALSAAFLWAAATLMFGRIGQQLSPIVLNLVKGAFAIALILVTLRLRAPFVTVLVGLSTSDTFYLLLSGGIGIGLGDTAYFAAINSLGARKALLLETLAPPMAAFLAWAFLGEQLSAKAVAGIGCTLLGVFWVISERTDNEAGVGDRTNAQRRSPTAAGLSIALVAVFCQASGAVISRSVLAETAVDPLVSALLRLLAGMGFTAALMLVKPPPFVRRYLQRTFDTHVLQHHGHKSVMALKQPTLLVTVFIAAFLGTYLGLWLQQSALKYTAAGIAQALLATSPIFVLPMAALLGDRISYRATFGAAIALGGVWLLLGN